MSITKNQLARFRVINECLRNKRKRYWSVAELIDKILEKTDIPIKERTLKGDIALMRFNEQLNYEAPIDYCKRNKGYFYTDENYSFDHIPLTSDDIKSLEFATSTLLQYRDIGIFKDFVGTVDKLVGLVNNLKYTNHNSHLAFISFEKAPFTKGTDFLDELVDSIRSSQVLEIKYQKFAEDEPKSYLLSPYLLKEYRNRWYVLGRNHVNNSIITLGLDRIISFNINDDIEFLPMGEFNSESYFSNTIGVTYANEEAIDVILSFSPIQGQYLKTQYLHHSQMILEDNARELRLKLKIANTYELRSIILGYGSDVEVISPISLREQIATIYKESLSKY